MWIVMSHIGWGEEQTTIYNGLKLSLWKHSRSMRFKALRGSPKGKAQLSPFGNILVACVLKP